VRRGITKAIQQADRTMSHIRMLAHALRPPVLDAAGINLSLEDYCRELSEQTHLTVAYRGVELPEVPEEISISLFRLLQESMTNIVKHARAPQASVILTHQDGIITLTVQDNGVGFDVDAPRAGIGLVGMEERVRLLGGQLEIQSQPRQGTRVDALIPWKRMAEAAAG